MMQYKVISERDESTFEKYINHYASEGFLPDMSSLQVTNYNDRLYYSIIMYKAK